MREKAIPKLKLKQTVPKSETAADEIDIVEDELFLCYFIQNYFTI